jgi:hypothetical protein
MIWTRESFAVAKSRNSAKYEEIPGYHVPAELEGKIMRCLTESLSIDPKKAKVLPASFFDQAKVGKRVSSHPLHETYIGPQEKERRNDFYSRTDPGTLVAELDEPKGRTSGTEGFVMRVAEIEPLERVQRVYTTPLEQLQETWTKAADQVREQSRATNNEIHRRPEE